MDRQTAAQIILPIRQNYLFDGRNAFLLCTALGVLVLAALSPMEVNYGRQIWTGFVDRNCFGVTAEGARVLGQTKITVGVTAIIGDSSGKSRGSFI